MELNKSISSESYVADELANLKKVSEVSNIFTQVHEDLVICNADENHVKEIAELWANLAGIQQISLPSRYSFQQEGKDWQSFVRKKLNKSNNLLLVAQKKGEYEVRGFLYLQTITIPSSDLILKGIIEDIYTKPQYRKQNIATLLLNASLEWASLQNVKKIDLISITKAKDLLEFYLQYVKRANSEVNLELVII